MTDQTPRTDEERWFGIPGETDQTPRTEAGLVRFHPKSEVTMEAVPDGMWVTYDNAVKAVAQARADLYAADHKGKYRQGVADERKRIADAVRALAADTDDDGEREQGRAEWPDQVRHAREAWYIAGRADALREAAERVRALPLRQGGTGIQTYRAEVLAILTETEP